MGTKQNQTKLTHALVSGKSIIYSRCKYTPLDFFVICCVFIFSIHAEDLSARMGRMPMGTGVGDRQRELLLRNRTVPTDLDGAFRLKHTQK